MRNNRRKLAIVAAGAFLVLSGFWTGKVVYKRPEIELYFHRDHKSGYVTVYTYYRKPNGVEIRQGWCYEFDASGRSFNKTFYEHGIAVDSKAAFN